MHILLKTIIASAISTLISFTVFANQAPSFSLSTATGEVIHLSDYQGKPLVIHFWATWCPYCKKLQPGLDKLYLKYQKQGLEMIAISFWEESDATPQAELIKRGMHFQTLVNGDQVAKQYQVKGTPTTFFIDKSGNVHWLTNNSDPNNPKLEQAIQAIMK